MLATVLELREISRNYAQFLGVYRASKIHLRWKPYWQPIKGTRRLHFKPISLRYLNCGDTRTDEVEDAARFEVWKGTLGILGIPYMDVLRVLATILLLGNVEFVEGEGLEVI